MGEKGCSENKCVLKQATLVSQKYMKNTSSIKNRETAEERTGRLRADPLISNTGSSTPPARLGAKRFVVFR